MTDDEINKRVAEIEGWKETGDDDIWFSPDLSRCYQGLPPFTRLWELCGPLAVKHQIALDWLTTFGPPGVGIQRKAIAKFTPGGRSMRDFVDDESAPRAICLAVIAKN